MCMGHDKKPIFIKPGMRTGRVDSLKHFVFVLYAFISLLVLLLLRTHSQSLCYAGLLSCYWFQKGISDTVGLV